MSLVTVLGPCIKRPLVPLVMYQAISVTRTVAWSVVERDG